MSAEICQNQLLQVAEKRLVGEDWKTGVEIYSSPERRPDPTGIENFFQFRDGPLPAPVLVDKEWDLRFLTKANHGLGLSEIIRHRFLTDDGRLSQRRQLDHLTVGRRTSDHIKNIGTLFLNHLGGFCVEVFDAESTRCLLGLVFIQVANRDAADIGKFLPCWD